MDFCIVLHRELREGVAVGDFNEQEPAALAAALDDCLRLIEIQEHSVLVTSVQILALVDTIRLILSAVVRDMAVREFVPCGDLLSGDGGQGDLIGEIFFSSSPNLPEMKSATVNLGFCVKVHFSRSE